MLAQEQVVPESIIKLIEAYGKVQPNLKLDDAGYSDAATLVSLVKKAWLFTE